MPVSVPEEGKRTRFPKGKLGVSNPRAESLVLFEGNGLLRNDPKFPPFLLLNRKTILPSVLQLQLVQLLTEREGDKRATARLLQIKGEKRDGDMGDPQPVPAAWGGTSNPSC